jgi:predicted aspartyl protease
MPPMGPFAKFLAAALLVASFAVSADAAECVRAEDLPVATSGAAVNAASGPTRDDRVGRIVAPIMVNGRGPYRLIVDTGANRSALSQALADELGLAPIGTGEVHSVHGVSIAPIVQVDSLTYGQVNLPSQPLPLLQGPVLAGQQGLLGVDGMAGRRLRLDFVRRCIEITPSAGARRLIGWTTLRGEMRFGNLVVLRGRIRNVDVNVLVDTGSDSSLANIALRDALRARAAPRADMLEYARAYSAGEPIVLQDAVALPELRLGELTVTDLLAYVGDFHIFEMWRLQDEPTLLIGMDVLRQSRGVAIDYERGTVHFRVRRGGPAVSTMDSGRRR